jgi:anion-transporting  ArsA/GET3 family ATPase
MFQDPKQSGVVVVALPEDMPTNETVELVEALKGELSLPVAQLVINQVLPELFSETERLDLLRPRDFDRQDPGDEALACGVRRAIRERVQAESLAKLAALGIGTVRLPRLFGEADTPAAVERLAKDHFS